MGELERPWILQKQRNNTSPFRRCSRVTHATVRAVPSAGSSGPSCAMCTRAGAWVLYVFKCNANVRCYGPCFFHLIKCCDYLSISAHAIFISTLLMFTQYLIVWINHNLCSQATLGGHFFLTSFLSLIKAEINIFIFLVTVYWDIYMGFCVPIARHFDQWKHTAWFL